MTLSIAVRELREASGLSQQAFSQRVGLSLRSIANYEKDRAPTAKSLFQFAKLASQLKQTDLASVFSRAYQTEVGDAAIDTADELQRSILIAIHQNNGPDWLEHQLADLIRKSRGGAVLAYPLILDAGHVPDQKMILAYLERLLVELRLQSASSAGTLLEDMAAERAEQSGETKELAYLEILKNNPELYARYNQERADAARGTRLESSLAVHGTRQHAERQQKKAKRNLSKRSKK
jgi:transcriptional regulator with XRE-family HTH domain